MEVKILDINKLLKQGIIAESFVEPDVDAETIENLSKMVENAKKKKFPAKEEKSI